MRLLDHERDALLVPGASWIPGLVADEPPPASARDDWSLADQIEAAAMLVSDAIRDRADEPARVFRALTSWRLLRKHDRAMFDGLIAQLDRDARAVLLRRLAVPEGDTPADGRAPFRVLTAADLATLPRARDRVRGVLPAEGMAAIYGPAGSGKTFLALDLLAAVSDGREWFGHRVESCPVVYVALEGEAGIAQRLKAYSERHGQAPSGLRFILEPFALLEGGDVAELAQAVRAAGCAEGIVAIDTLNRAAPGADENDSRDMGRIIAGAKALQSALGGLVLLVHHAGKDTTRGLRGHSSLMAALDAVIEVSRDGERREWRVAKSKDGPDGATHPFRLSVVELGSDGEPITSCVVEPEQSPSEAVRRVKVPQGGNQRIVWDALGEVLRNASEFGQAGAPPGRPCIRIEAAIERCRGRLTCSPDRQTERAREAITGLVNRGALTLRDGWLWAT
ncbi:AAA family ATPase [Zeimonas arvi]|uniref:AAA family ATPase n=1 Tax=Zeimonas arvi TaxID=2498847 RepID=A0A5C8NNR8_9BURK|nr:AAA family ATPase [Zeimonas arvi]TXL62461.1 AAA family ATPase [Zeimonas arvi]